MEEFLEEVRQHAEQRNIKPATVIYYADRRNSKTWNDWVTGASSPTMKTIEKIRQYMRGELQTQRAAEQ